MSTIYNSTILWTSPLLDYEPVGQWENGRTFVNSTLSLNFWGTGIHLFGHANSQSYAINLDGQPRQNVQRHYSQNEVGISDPLCQNPTPDQCLVLYETSGLNPNEMHTLVLTSLLNGQDQSKAIDIQSVTVAFDAGVSVDNHTVTTLQPNDTSLVYTGDWTQHTNGEKLYMMTSTAGDSVNFNFTGYALWVTGSNEFGAGSYEVILDGEPQDCLIEGQPQMQLNLELTLLTRAGLDQGMNHSVTITNKQAQRLMIGTSQMTTLLEGTASFATTSAGPPSWLSSAVTSLPTTTTNTENPTGNIPEGSQKSTVFSGAVIGGIAVGATAFLALIIIIILIYRRRTQKRKALKSHAYKSSADHSNASEEPLVPSHPSITPYRVPNSQSAATTPSPPTRNTSIEKSPGRKAAAVAANGTSSPPSKGKRKAVTQTATQEGTVTPPRDSKRRLPATQTDTPNAGQSVSERRREKAGLHHPGSPPKGTSASAPAANTSTPRPPPISRNEKAILHERAMAQARNAPPITFTSITFPDDRRTTS